RDWLEVGRGSPHPGTRLGSDLTVPPRAVHASRLSPDALRHWRGNFTNGQAAGRPDTRSCATLAIPVGVGSWTPRHHSRSLVCRSASPDLTTVCPPRRIRNDC